MSFLEEIKEIENKRESKEDSVINEIVNCFIDKFNSEKFKEYLKGRIEYQINKSSKTLTLQVQYNWYSSSSKKVFECGGYTFETEEYRYKGIDFYDIQEKVCDRLSEILIEKLKELELNVVSEIRQDKRSYYYKEITISW